MSLLTKVKRIAKEEALAAVGAVYRNTAKVAEDKIVFCVDGGKGYRCNPKYIAEEMHRRNPSLDLVWIVKREEEKTLPSYVRSVRYGSLDEIKELATAKIWVDNGRRRRCVRKREGQYYIQAWHGAISPKRIERDAEAKLTARYVHFAMKDAADTDLMFANNDLYEKLFKESFWYDGPVLRCGMPRNKPLIRPDGDVKARVFSSLGVKESAKLCLYAPTFRSDYRLDVYDFDYARCCDALSERFGGTFQFAVRLHPGISHLSIKLKSGDFLDATNYCDTQELLSAADVLISDYSSVAEDFMLTRRPCFIYAPDFDSYMNERGLYYSLETRPFPVARSEDELIEQIAEFSAESYEKKVDSFSQKFGIVDDGKGDQVIASLMEDVLANRQISR